MRRRTLLRGVLAGSAVALTAAGGLFKPKTTLALPNDRDAFQLTEERELVRRLFGTESAIPDDGVTIEAPLQAMYGKGVPVTVQCAMTGVELIAIITRHNRRPLNTFVRLQGADGFYSTRIRLEQTSPVVAYVKAGDTVYTASTLVKVSHGGYGTHLE